MGGEQDFFWNNLTEKGGEVMEGQRRPGAPPGNRNSVKHNRYGRELRQVELRVGQLIHLSGALLAKFEKLHKEER